MRTPKYINSEITRLEKEILKLKKEKENIPEMTNEIKLAELLHFKLCRHNHIDQCDWDYGNWKDLNYSRKEYLNKAVKLLSEAPYNTITRIIEKL